MINYLFTAEVNDNEKIILKAPSKERALCYLMARFNVRNIYLASAVDCNTQPILNVVTRKFENLNR